MSTPTISQVIFSASVSGSIKGMGILFGVFQPSICFLGCDPVAFIRPRSQPDLSMRFRKAGYGVPFDYFLEQGLFRLLDNPLQAVPRSAIGDLLAGALQDLAHLAVPGHPAMEVVDRYERDERRGHDRQG